MRFLLVVDAPCRCRWIPSEEDEGIDDGEAATGDVNNGQAPEDPVDRLYLPRGLRDGNGSEGPMAQMTLSLKICMLMMLVLKVTCCTVMTA